MSNGNSAPFKPLVTSATTAQSPDVSTIMNGLKQGRYAIPDYQRDSSQWDIAKKSLFIESLINNLTIPPLIIYPEDDKNGIETRHIIDGQQRLTTIQEYINDKFALANENEVEYADNVGPMIHGKKYSQLSPKLQQQINNYTINLIILPREMELSLRLEVFRRINEGGVPLSPHDLRLATFGNSERVWLIRLAGIFDPEREGSKRMITAAQSKFQMDYPWKNYGPWKKWWKDLKQSFGQASSEMFLYYIIARDLENLNQLLNSSSALQALKLKNDRTTAAVLDIYCAQLQREESAQNAPQILARLDVMKEWFAEFERWFIDIKSHRIPSLPLNSSRKLAFFIAAAAQIFGVPDSLTEPQWELAQFFLTEGPGDINQKFSIDYPIAKGRWPGQKSQIEQTYKICEKIYKAK